MPEWEEIRWDRFHVVDKWGKIIFLKHESQICSILASFEEEKSLQKECQVCLHVKFALMFYY